MSDTLPLWDLTTVFPSMESNKYKAERNRFISEIEEFESFLKIDNLGDPKTWLTEALDRHDRITDLHEELESYIYTQFSTNTTDPAILKELNKIEADVVQLKSTGTLFCDRLAELNEEGKLFPAVESGGFESHRFFIEESLEEQKHQMSREEESLAAELSMSGADAWARLQESVSSTVSTLWDEGTGETKTVIELRALAYHKERDVRKNAFEKEISLWKQMETPLAYALNGIKGTSLTLCKRRGWESPLDISLRSARISRETLDALIGVMTDNLPVFRKYLKAKAELMGVEKLAFYDIFAPMEAATEMGFDEVRTFIIDKFSAFSPRMGAYAKKAFDSNWLDTKPREGKVGGAYCTSFPLTGESRILCNFDGSYDALTTVAHELGHGYHHEILKDEKAVARQYPMTLAETASIFAENVVFNQAVSQAKGAEKLALIEDFLKSATQVIVDILSRFIFEESVFEKRKEGELSADEFSALMIEAQKKTYGDAILESELHPYMWAVKGHYYIPGLDFYNFPYAFGQLFGMGLYGQYEEKGSSFAADYDELLLHTGTAPAEKVTTRAGFDITKRDFWQRGIDTIAGHVETFVQLVKEETK
ncbi:MAG: M3 family oligoendopeptidase [Spirochaetales bacterium]|nr:M3 family oligoendopeptidase [Spirochaetales bacterium]